MNNTSTNLSFTHTDRTPFLVKVVGGVVIASGIVFIVVVIVVIITKSKSSRGRKRISRPTMKLQPTIEITQNSANPRPQNHTTSKAKNSKTSTPSKKAKAKTIKLLRKPVAHDVNTSANHTSEKYTSTLSREGPARDDANISSQIIRSLDSRIDALRFPALTKYSSVPRGSKLESASPQTTSISVLIPSPVNSVESKAVGTSSSYTTQNSDLMLST